MYDNEASQLRGRTESRLVLIGLLCLAAVAGLMITATVLLAGGISE